MGINGEIKRGKNMIKNQITESKRGDLLDRKKRGQMMKK